MLCNNEENKMKHLNIIFLILLISCKGMNYIENENSNEQLQFINTNEWDYYKYSFDGRILFDEINTLNSDNINKDNNLKFLSFLLSESPKNIVYIINGNTLIGNVVKLNIYSEYGDYIDRQVYESLRYYRINYLEIEYENEDRTKNILKFRIYSIINYMDNENSLIIRMSTKLLNDIEEFHNYFDGFYLGIIDFDINKNIIKIVVEYVPNNYGVFY